jgi:hypothetical protein
MLFSSIRPKGTLEFKGQPLFKYDKKSFEIVILLWLSRAKISNLPCKIIDVFCQQSQCLQVPNAGMI